MSYDVNLIDKIRAQAGIATRTPPWSVTAFTISNELGIMAAYADKVTGLLTDPVSKSAFAGAQTPQAQATIAGDGALTIANGSTYLTKGSAAAITLAAPTAAQAGIRITVVSGSSFAHVITATSLLLDGATGVPHTTATFAAFKGASIILEANNLLWSVVSNNHVTIS